MYSKSTIERFWSKVDVRSEDECWEWQGAKQVRGYGLFKLNGKSQLAHRIAFLYHNHHLPDLEICHSCDNQSCCNPNHLWAGTHDDNMKDMVAKGRLLKRVGTDNPAAKMTIEKVLEIRRLSSKGWNGSVLSKIYSVTPETISAIVLRKTWKHV